MKNTTRHKTGLNPARGLWERCELPSGVRGGAPKALALFMFVEGKIQHLINIQHQTCLNWQPKNVIYAGAPAEIFTGGGQAMYLLSTGSNKTLQLQPRFGKGLEPKVKWSCTKNVAIERHVEQINAIQIAYIMAGGLEAKPPVQARSQKFAMGGLLKNLGAKPPVLQNFSFFCKNNLILELF